MVPVAAFMWSPIWVLEDSGVVAFLKPEQRNKRQTPDTEGVGRYYRIYLNGFVGISTIIGLGNFFYRSVILQLDAIARNEALFGLLVLLLIPLYAILSFSPLLLVHERFFRHHREKLTESLVKQKVVSSPDQSTSTPMENSVEEKSESQFEDDGFTMS
jgi:hypothetical protein